MLKPWKKAARLLKFRVFRVFRCIIIRRRRKKNDNISVKYEESIR